MLDIAWILPGYTGQFPEMGLFELPFLFDTALEAATVGWRSTTQALTGFDGVRLIGFSVRPPTASLCAARSIPAGHGRV